MNSLRSSCCFFVCLLVGILSVSAESDEKGYILSEISTGPAFSQTVLLASLYDSNTHDLVVIDIDENNDRHLNIYRVKDQALDSKSVFQMELSPEFIVIDKINLGGKDFLAFLSRDTIYIWRPEQNSFKPLLHTSSSFKSPIFRSLPRVSFVEDLNGDGLEDLMIPDFDGYNLYVQSGGSDNKESEDKENAFKKSRLMIRAEMDLFYDTDPWYNARKPYKGDYDLDGRDDIWFWNGQAFTIYRQIESNLFSPDAEVYEPDIELDFETADRISFGSRDQQASVKFLYSIVDMDNDGIVDMTTLVMDSKGLFKKSSTYDLYKGKAHEGRVIFSAQPESSIKSKGIQFNLMQKDFDSDGLLDVEMTTVEIGIGKIIGALLTGSVKLDLKFYRSKEGLFPDSATVERRVKAEINFSTGKVFYPSVFTRDMGEDGISDLVVQHKRDKVRIYEGTGDRMFFSKKPLEIDLAIDSDPLFLEPVDLNGDGRKDLIVQFSTDPGQKSFERGVKAVIFD